MRDVAVAGASSLAKSAVSALPHRRDWGRGSNDQRRKSYDCSATGGTKVARKIRVAPCSIATAATLVVAAAVGTQGFGRERCSAPVGAHGSTDFDILGSFQHAT